MSLSPIADCDTQTSVSNPMSTAVLRFVCRIAWTMSGHSASPNDGLVSTGVPGSRHSSSPGSVAPSRSGASSVTTTGISNWRATAASQRSRSTTSSAALRSGSASAKNPGCVSTTTSTLSARSISGMAPSYVAPSS